MVEDLEDFSYLVSLGPNLTAHVHELTPKDFVLAQILRDKNKGYVSLLERVIKNNSILDEVSARQFRKLADWVLNNIFFDSIMTVEGWMKTAFHLNKQRWDPGIDWLESQPMSKIKVMIDINRECAEEQRDEMKRAAKRK